MQIKFKQAYRSELPLEAMQANLLNLWAQNLKASQVKYIKNAKISFDYYDFWEYPDQEKLKHEWAIQNNITEKDLESVYKKLYNDIPPGTLKIMELTIIPEDY